MFVDAGGTTPDKKDEVTLKQKAIPTLGFGEGKFNTLTTDKKKPPKGKKKKGLGLKKFFTRDKKGKPIPCGANFAE